MTLQRVTLPPEPTHAGVAGQAGGRGKTCIASRRLSDRVFVLTMGCGGGGEEQRQRRPGPGPPPPEKRRRNPDRPGPARTRTDQDQDQDQVQDVDEPTCRRSLPGPGRDNPGHPGRAGVAAGRGAGAGRGAAAGHDLARGGAGPYSRRSPGFVYV